MLDVCGQPNSESEQDVMTWANTLAERIDETVNLQRNCFRAKQDEAFLISNLVKTVYESTNLPVDCVGIIADYVL